MKEWGNPSRWLVEPGTRPRLRWLLSWWNELVWRVHGF